MRRHIIERMKLDNLFTLAECKLALKHLCALIVREAQHDFQQLLYLDAHYRATVMPKMLEMYDGDGDGILDQDELSRADFKVPQLSKWDVPKMSILSENIQPLVDELKVVDETEPAAKLKNTIIGVHTSMLRIISINNAQRADRLTVMKSLLSQLESGA